MSEKEIITKLTDNVQVVVMPFTTGYIHESVVLNEDGSYTIFIDDNLSPCAKQKAFFHAVMHIIRGDFYKDADINEIEAVAHGF